MTDTSLQSPQDVSQAPKDSRTPIISTRHLAYTYRYKPFMKRERTRQVLKDVSLDIYSGECVTLLGRNGAGKSTLFKCLSGIRSDYEGQLLIFGREVKNGKVVDKNHHMGVIAPVAFTVLRVWQVFRFFCGVYKIPFSPEVVKQTLARVKMENTYDKRFYTLSTGQFQRVRIAITLMGSPDLLLLDEPSSGLDTAARYDFWNLLNELRHQGCTIVLITHYLREIEHFFDRAIVLDQGKVALDKPIQDILNEAPFKKRVSFNILPLGKDAQEVIQEIESNSVLPVKCDAPNTFMSIYCDDDDAVVSLLQDLYPNHFEQLSLDIRLFSLEDVFVTITHESLTDEAEAVPASSTADTPQTAA